MDADPPEGWRLFILSPVSLALQRTSSFQFAVPIISNFSFPISN
jgi:hypothetical protein